MKTIINWLDFTEENLNNCFKDIVNECKNNHKKCYKINILVLAKEKKSKSEVDKFKGKYKLMASEVDCYWSDNKNMINGVPKVNFWPKNISELSIIKFIPMQEAIPKELNN